MTSTANDPTARGARLHQRWTEEEITRMIALRAERYTAAEIAVMMGRTKSAIHEAFYKLREASRTEFVCSWCRVLLPAEAFTPSARWRGARCRKCIAVATARISAERRITGESKSEDKPVTDT
jgi:hypothetical protein